ncbi:MAG: M23 family metallopeptidase [Pseudonocardia sp.]|uniref:M23 family metallopeptidase n=1 Tax=unclassified Pseudonocardia TaxID=2619320 RepID=UPI00086A5FA8|nr:MULTISPECIES: M23 family metallopeptidase [unclassified Pseudonocardia]MBN9111271.1 M23 family metallopeptidase [Pseudonocardia sp.]ODV06279.1 MAG: hypothetical protein ABT15_13530 [Pseudonocardia sp. SCN 73-27]
MSGALPARILATVVAGGAVAVTAQAVHSGALSPPDVTALLRTGTSVGGSSGALGADEPAAVSAPVTGADVVALASDDTPAISPDVLHVVSERGADLVASTQQQVDAALARQAAAQQAVAAKAAEEAQAKAEEAERAVQIVTGRVSSGFGMRGGVMHAGLDIAAPIGTPIRVPLDGVVISSGPASGFGLWVRVQHADGTITVYGHINRSMVQVGQKVTAGQQIAEVGNRGQSTGPHLHIEVQTPGGQKIDPRGWLNSHGFRYQ